MKIIHGTQDTTEEIGREYEIKPEEEWDVSKNQDGSVIAKWKLEDKSITISGSGEMKNWSHIDKEDWHDTQYTKAIEKIIIGKGVTSIGSYAFKGCSSLKEIEIPEGVTSIRYYAFESCSSLEQIEIPESVTSIEACAFDYCSSLEEIEIPEGVTSIGNCAFRGCSSLERIEISNSVTLIGIQAFNECSSLKEIEIPESVTSIEGSAFSGCSSLERIDVNDENQKYTSIDGILYNKEKNKIIKYPANKDGEYYRTIDGVTSIGTCAFSECSNLEQIEIPESVTSIEVSAFNEVRYIVCKQNSYAHKYAEENKVYYILYNRTDISTEIGDEYEIKNEEEWDVSENQDGSVIARWKLEDKSITISGSGKMKNWDYNDKEDWHKTKYTEAIEKVVIKEGVTSIGNCAFIECSNLEQIEIPESVTSIGSYAFNECSSLERIDVADGNQKYTSIEGVLYKKEKKEIIKYPANKEGEYYRIIDGVISIGFYAFQDCSSLQEIEIPESVISIDWHAFEKCSSLKEIEIPEGVKLISSSVFYGCSSLEQIKIPESVSLISSYAFDGCSSLKEIEIPNGVTSIGGGAFRGCSSLERIEIPESVTSIGNSAFYGCSSLTEIEIPNGVTEIGSLAFGGCSSLKEIKIPESVTSIGWGAFSGCSSLERIEIPDIVTSIEGGAFNGVRYIVCEQNSYAHRYAEEKKVPYILIDEIAPTVTIKYSTQEKTNQNVTVTITADEEIQEVAGWTRSSDKRALTKEYSQNTAENVTVKDLAGNETIVNISIANIDKTVSIEEIKYSTKEKTNQNVTVTITAKEEIQEVEGWTLSSDKRALTKEYSQNTTENVTVKDLVGNETTVNISIANIDKTVSIEGIKYSTQEITNQNVTVTITAKEEIQEISGWTRSSDKRALTKEYSQNTTEKVTIKDLAGNNIKVNIGITNIDKKVPTAEIKYSTQEITNQNVTVTITASEEIQEVEGWTRSSDKRALTKEYSQNTTENVTVKDLAGNETTVNISIANIDKTVSIEGIKYSTQEKTNQNVKVTITAKEEIQEVAGWTLSSDKKVLTKEYSQNTTEKVTIKDLAGNNIDVNIGITNIDKKVPTAEIKYSTKENTNQNVKVTITASEEIQEIAGWTRSSDKKVLTKEYSQNTTEKVTVKDLAGNNIKANIGITNIDKKVPTAEIKYSTKENTNQNVTVTITASEEIQEIEGWTLSSDKKALTKEYRQNTTEKVTIKDLAGNETTVNISITNITIKKGDVDGNNAINIGDILKLKRYIAYSKSETTKNNHPTWKLSEREIQLGDVNQNGVIDIGDIMKIQRYIAASNSNEIARKHSDWLNL